MASEVLDSIGFVVDFTDVKDKVGGWIDEHWDHAFLVSGRDEEMLTALRGVKGSRVFVFPDANPSAEVMARELYRTAEELCGVTPSMVRVWESPTQYAEYGAV